jgi:hypothetical protein
MQAEACWRASYLALVDLWYILYPCEILAACEQLCNVSVRVGQTKRLSGGACGNDHDAYQWRSLDQKSSQLCSHRDKWYPRHCPLTDLCGKAVQKRPLPFARLECCSIWYIKGMKDHLAWRGLKSRHYRGVSPVIEQFVRGHSRFQRSR